MLLRLLSGRLSPYRKLIDQAIRESITDISDDGVNQVINQILMDEAQCWISFQIENNKRKIEGLVLTFINKNPIMDFQAINVLCAYFPDGSSEQTWRDIVNNLKDYGTSRGCDRLEFFTNVPAIKSIARMLNAEYKSTYYQIPFV